MKSMQEFFRTQMGTSISPPAKEKLFAKILPKLCIENYICPVCSGDLKKNDGNYCHAYIGSIKECIDCGATYKGEMHVLPR